MEHLRVNWWILGPVLFFEIGCLLFLLRGFLKFERDPYQAHLKNIRVDLEMKKAAKRRASPTDRHYVS